ncbi:hypothetical protein GE09DRAFT_72482 [Coniochaeta sp. 2T2.1]|nr:hypothetical protein GE09DRAFT_72482 [Coniochaeta sp. 2T2.1]
MSAFTDISRLARSLPAGSCPGVLGLSFYNTRSATLHTVTTTTGDRSAPRNMRLPLSQRTLFSVVTPLHISGLLLFFPISRLSNGFMIMYLLWVFSSPPRRYSVIPPFPSQTRLSRHHQPTFLHFYTGVLGARFGHSTAHHGTFMVGIRSANYRFYEWIRIYSMRKIPLLYPLVFYYGRTGRQAGGRADWIGLAWVRMISSSLR